MPLDFLIYLFCLGIGLFPAWFCWQYFTNPVYADRQRRSLQWLTLISSAALILAAALCAWELTAYRGTSPMDIHPIEHVDSPERALMYLVVVCTGFTVTWVAVHRRGTRLPDLRLVAGSALVLLFISSAGYYISPIGFCCESPSAVFLGYPFSFIYGRLPDSGMSLYQGMGLSFSELFSVMTKDVVYWTPRLPGLLLDGLFWTQIILLISSPIVNAFSQNHRI